MTSSAKVDFFFWVVLPRPNILLWKTLTIQQTWNIFTVDIYISPTFGYICLNIYLWICPFLYHALSILFSWSTNVVSGLLNLLKMISICWDSWKSFTLYLKRKFDVHLKTLFFLVTRNTNTMPLCCLSQRIKCDSADELLAMTVNSRSNCPCSVLCLWLRLNEGFSRAIVT